MYSDLESNESKRFHQLEGMAPDEYLRKRQTGEVPDILEVDARLTHVVEKIFESVCPRPPAEYLDKLNGELERLGSIAVSPERKRFINH